MSFTKPIPNHARAFGGTAGEVLVELLNRLVGQDHDVHADPTDGDGPPDAEEIWLSSGMDEDYDLR